MSMMRLMIDYINLAFLHSFYHRVEDVTPMVTLIRISVLLPVHGGWMMVYSCIIINNLKSS